MKQLLFFFLLPCIAFAQREVQSDTAWLTRQLVTAKTDTTPDVYEYFLNKRYDYTNGESVTQKLLLGDSATAINAVTGQQIDYIRDLADKAATVIRKAPIIREWEQMHNQTTAVGIGSMAAIIQGLFEQDIIGDVTVKVGSAAAVPGDIMKAANGNIRLLFGNKGYRIFVFSDTMLRVMGYPVTGNETDVYRVAPRVFKDITGEFTIRLKK